MDENSRRAVVVCDQWLGSNGYAGMKALRRAGWNVEVVPEWEFVPVRWTHTAVKVLGKLIRTFAVKEFNRALAETVSRFSPSLVLVFKGMFVSAKTLVKISEIGVRTYCFYPDNSVFTHGPWLPMAMGSYDWIFTAKSFGLSDLRESLGITHASLLYHGFDRDLHRPLTLGPKDHEKFKCDVSFIGTWSKKKELIVEHLARQRPSLKLRIWGSQWRNVSPGSVLTQSIEGREVSGDDYPLAISGSTINLAILSERRRGASRGDQITSRTFHIPASGGFMLHERTDELLTLFEEEQNVACFTDADEMIEKVDFYLTHGSLRENIRVRCLEKVTSRHSWDHRIQHILEHHANTMQSA